MEGKPLIVQNTFGHGPCVTVWVHGWLRSSRMFEPLLPFMDPHADRWIFVDLPGYGENRKASGEFTVDRAVTELAQFTEEAGLDQAHWVGHSMGGLVIQRLAFRVPQRVISLVGIAPVPITGLALNERAREIYQKACKSVEARFRVIARLADPATATETIQNWVVQSFSETQEDALWTYLESWSVERQELTPPDFSSIPFVLVAGAGDPAITKARITGSIASLYRHLEVHILDGIGHLPVEEDTFRVAQALAKWPEKQVGSETSSHLSEAPRTSR